MEVLLFGIFLLLSISLIQRIYADELGRPIIHLILFLLCGFSGLFSSLIFQILFFTLLFIGIVSAIRQHLLR